MISSARQTLDVAGLEDVPLLVGTSGNSARETIQFNLSKEAKERGVEMWKRGIWNWMGSGLQREILWGFDAELLEESVMQLAVQRFGQSEKRTIGKEHARRKGGNECEGERDKRRKGMTKAFSKRSLRARRQTQQPASKTQACAQRRTLARRQACRWPSGCSCPSLRTLTRS